MVGGVARIGAVDARVASVVPMPENRSSVIGISWTGTRPHEALGLRDLAAATRSALTLWRPGTDWTHARNAHETNSVASMASALRSPANWLEGDVRRDDRGQLVMAHDIHDLGHGLSFGQWLMTCIASGRGIKIDIKEPAALAGVLAQLERFGVDDRMLIINVPVAGANVGDAISDAQLRDIRRRFPNATINLSPTNHHTLTDAVVAELARTARVVGGHVMFPLQWDLITDRVIQGLRAFGHVAIWSTVWWGTPADPSSEAASLRLRGVTGMIDLEHASAGQQLLSLATQGLGLVLGRQALLDARNAVVAARDAVLDLFG